MHDFLLLGLQTPEVLELSKQIKEKLKEADQYGNVYNSLCRNLVLEREREREIVNAIIGCSISWVC